MKDFFGRRWNGKLKEKEDGAVRNVASNYKQVNAELSIVGEAMKSSSSSRKTKRIMMEIGMRYIDPTIPHH